MTQNDILNTKAKIVNLENLKMLIFSINANHCYDKAGDLFYVIEQQIKEDKVYFDTVVEFLHEIETNHKVSSKSYGYIVSEVTVLSFDSIKYSNTTNIFYKIQDNELYRFCAYKLDEKRKPLTNENGNTKDKLEYKNITVEWELSDFSDLNNVSREWVDGTETQIKKYNLV
jgi:hypothetical protein